MRQPPLILVVDDEADIREISRARLLGAGFVVEVVDDARTAYDMARKLRPDLVLMDIHMPGTNGTEAVLDFKNDPDLKDIRIVFFTNLTTPWPGVSGSNEKMAKELGAVHFLDKSKDMDTLGEKVKAILAETNK